MVHHKAVTMFLKRQTSRHIFFCNQRNAHLQVSHNEACIKTLISKNILRSMYEKEKFPFQNFLTGPTVAQPIFSNGAKVLHNPSVNWILYVNALKITLEISTLSCLVGSTCDIRDLKVSIILGMRNTKAAVQTCSSSLIKAHCKQLLVIY